MKKKPSEWVCARCGLPIQQWFFGWKHSAGGKSKPSCGQQPLRVSRVDYENKVERKI